MRTRISVLSIALTLLPGFASAAPVAEYPRLEEIARASLASNIRVCKSGPYLSAGSNQFQGLWTRDFSFASGGLLATGRADVVKSQLTAILKLIRADGLLPRYLDSYSTSARYMAKALGIKLPTKDPLKPNYKGGSNLGIVADSNALVILTALRYVAETGDGDWWKQMEPDLVRAYRFYDDKIEDGLVKQGPYADWQDSVKREGFTFYVNVLYWAATQRLVTLPAFGVTQERADQLKDRILARFEDPVSGLFSSVLGGRTSDGEARISLDGILLALDLGLVPYGSERAVHLYEALKHHKLWRVNGNVPGAATWPPYSAKEVGSIPKGSGLLHYHDTIYWSWLMGLSAKISFRMGDAEESDRILSELERMAVRDGAIAEVYRPQPELPLNNTRVYASEKPFSWGAGLILEALLTRRNR